MRNQSCLSTYKIPTVLICRRLRKLTGLTLVLLADLPLWLRARRRPLTGLLLDADETVRTFLGEELALNPKTRISVSFSSSQFSTSATSGSRDSFESPVVAIAMNYYCHQSKANIQQRKGRARSEGGTRPKEGDGWFVAKASNLNEFNQ